MGDACSNMLVMTPTCGMMIATVVGSRSEFYQGESVTEIELPLKKFTETYFRITIIDEFGKRAWTNPIWLSS